MWLAAIVEVLEGSLRHCRGICRCVPTITNTKQNVNALGLWLYCYVCATLSVTTMLWLKYNFVSSQRIVHNTALSRVEIGLLAELGCHQ